MTQQGFDLQAAGAVASLPFLSLWVGSLVGGLLADKLHNGFGWTNVTVRNFMVVVPQINYAVCGCLLAAGVSASMTVVLLVLSNFFEGFVGSGLWVKPLDLSRRYAACIMVSDLATV